MFSVSTGGEETVLHDFKGDDGAYPTASLINVNGTLYGTTSGACASLGCAPLGCKENYARACGTVFSATTSGDVKVLHAFNGGSDGESPVAQLVDVNGTLYGTTEYGGRGSQCGYFKNSGCGTVYSITTSGKEKVIYTFKGGSDGAYPVAGLTNVRGTLYGTTSGGGNGSGFGGTVFSMGMGGKEKILHVFSGSADGFSPAAGLTKMGDMLYGTTEYGGSGSGCADNVSCGTAYSVTTTGSLRTLHVFRGGDSDGALPMASLIDVKGELYGTTQEGGRNLTHCSSGCGTIFSLTASGVVKVLYRFESRSGGRPMAALLDVNGIFYDTTPGIAAAGDLGPCETRRLCGTVFSFGH